MVGNGSFLFHMFLSLFFFSPRDESLIYAVVEGEKKKKKKNGKVF